MSVRYPNGLAWATVRARPASFAGTFLALLFASIIVTACGTLLQNGVTASLAPERYAAPQVVVAADQNATIAYGQGDEADSESEPLPGTRRLDLALAGRIAALPGVAAAVPDWGFPVQGKDGALTGRPWSASRITSAALAEGGAPSAGEVVLDAGVARATGYDVGSDIALTSAQGTRTYRVSGLAGENGAVWFADAEAGSLAGHPGQADAIAVFAEPGVTDEQLARTVEGVVGKAEVHTGDGRGVLEHPELGQAQENLTGIGGSFGGIATTVAIFVVLGTVALAVGQRAREIALLRAIGATPRQIRRTVATEAMIVAPIAGAAGAVLGVGLAAWWFGELRERGAVPEGLELSVGWIPIVSAIGSGLVAALLGGWAAARRPARARPSQALGEASVRRTRPGVIRTLLGVGALAGAVALARAAASATGEEAVEVALGVVTCFMLAVALLGPVIAWVSSLVLGAALRPAGASGELAAVNARTDARRLASAITPIVLTVAFTGTLTFIQSTVGKATSEQAREGVVAQHVLTGAGAGLPENAARRAGRVQGVDAAVGVLRSGVLIRNGNDFQDASALGLGGRADQWPKVLDLGLHKGRLSDRPGTIAVDRLTAETIGVDVGDRVRMWLPDGTPATATVAATYERGLGLGQVVLPRAALAGHAPHGFDSEVLVSAPAADQDALRRELARQVQVPGLTVAGKAGYTAQVDEDMALNAWANLVMAVVLGGFAAIAAMNTLVMTILDRRAEVALLRLAGATRRQIRRMVLWEAVLVTATGLLIGTAILAVTLVPIARGTTGGAPYVPAGIALPVALGIVALGLAATALPARALLRTRPAATVITE
jgi:putative ABC transport system permease protein